MITDANEFKQRLQAIQQNSTAVFKTLPSNEPRIIIDANSREISIPVEFDFLAVKTDHKAETIYFEIDRYFDDEDLSKHTCVVQWVNKSDEGISPCTELDIDTFDGKIVFGWEITNDCTRVDGPIEFSVRFYTFDDLGSFAYNFNTLPAESKILDTLNSNGEKEPTRPSSFQVWVDKLYFLEQNCVTYDDLQNMDIGGMKNLTSNDGSIKVTGSDNYKNISVAVSSYDKNILTKKDDGLYVENQEDIFENLVTSISVGGISAGTPLKDKTVKEVLIMLLGAKDASATPAEFIMNNRIPAYVGTLGDDIVAVEYKLLNKNTASYQDSGFYTDIDNDESLIGAGYQVTIEGNNDRDAQVVVIPANAVVKMAYRYDVGGTNTWLAYSIEDNYWLDGDTIDKVVNGQTISYKTYVYNADLYGGGDAITSTEYWRFEIEVMH